MIRNDSDKEWMLPLLHFRNELDFRGDEQHALDRERRDFRRMSGVLTHYGMPSEEERKENPDWLEEVKLVPGPYIQDTRAYFLKKLLEIQQFIRNNPDTPPEAKEIEVLRMDELHEIRRIWLQEKHEIEDLLPSIYEEVLGVPFPLDERELPSAVHPSDLLLLKEQCNDDRMQYEMIRNLLDVEWDHRLKGKRVGLFKDLRKVIESCFFAGEEDALEFKKRELAARMTSVTIDQTELFSKGEDR
jgi:DNA sulfur modification protein DndC